MNHGTPMRGTLLQSPTEEERQRIIFLKKKYDLPITTIRERTGRAGDTIRKILKAAKEKGEL